MTTLRPPTEKEAFKGQLGAAVEQIETKLAENGLDKYLQTADKLLEEYSAQDLVALLLKTTAKDPADAVPVKITPERPLPMQKKDTIKMANVVAETTVIVVTAVIIVETNQKAVIAKIITAKKMAVNVTMIKNADL